MPRSVVLPAPFGPSSAHTLPARSSTSTPPSARWCPKRFATFLTVTRSSDISAPIVFSVQLLELEDEVLALRRLRGARAVHRGDPVEQVLDAAAALLLRVV